MPLSVPLRFWSAEPCPRRGEPVTVGIPWPRGAVQDAKSFELVHADGSSQVLQTNVLDRWPDGSVRWCLFDFLATWDGTSSESRYRIEVGKKSSTLGQAIRIEQPAGCISVTSHQYTFTTSIDRRFPLDEVSLEIQESHQSEPVSLRTEEMDIREQGPIRVRVNAEGTAWPNPHLMALADVDYFAGISVLRVQLTFRNTMPADHPGGNWDLGSHGAISLKSASIVIKPASPVSGTVRYSTERTRPFQTTSKPVQIHQESSGGENWQSRNHINAQREVPLRYRGYKTTIDHAESVTGNRATPIVILGSDTQFLGVTMPHFWENFPKGVETTNGELRLHLLPAESAHGHELQGGEQKTHVFYVSFGQDTITADPMVWCRSPLVVSAAPEWYASTGVVPYLTPKTAHSQEKHESLVEQALDGPDTFLTKRETIDEYGWRNFGDIYSDHEAAFHTGPTPLISHYNNQYDCVAAFAEQFFRSGDLRWYTQMLESADHTVDIDIYHTDHDKVAYNRGLFWHTYHYADADTGTHRSYPKVLRTGGHFDSGQDLEKMGETGAKLKKILAVGGGPAGSHNYNSGLMLAYYLTGNTLYRDNAVGLADFVIQIDDPGWTVFRWLSREYTGLATESNDGYHGPGRAAGNSILALLVGHQLTGDAKYLVKCDAIIRRAVHPMQNLERLDLLNAELRWFYTMTLQALGVYLDYKAELGQLDRMYGYAQLTLLHFAKWMATHERPILDKPEELQYPTESWAAQDMRKVEVFNFAAKHASGEDKSKYLERANWFFKTSVDALDEFPTKSLCRPVVLMMRYGWSHAWWQSHPTPSAPKPTVAVTADEFGTWTHFVPQKAKAMKRAKMLVVLGGLFAIVLFCLLLAWFFIAA